MTPRLFRAADVCEMAQLQPFVLRSWEKEFPGIGVQKSPEGPRFYRQSDLDQVRKIKELVFGEGLTLAGARRRLEETTAAGGGGTTSEDVAEVLEALASDARTRIAHVRDGLRAILRVLSSAPGAVVLVDDFALGSSPAPEMAPKKARPPRRALASGGRTAVKTSSQRSAAKPSAKRRKRANA